MSQTVKHAKRRTKQDPDRIDGAEGRDGVGIHYGTNLPYASVQALPNGPFVRAMFGQKTTRGACG